MFIPRFKDLKTSTQISIKFTLFTVSLVLLFGVVANITFFNNRYSKEAMMVKVGPPPTMGNAGIKIILGKNRGPNTEIFDINSNEGKAILMSKKRKSIIEIEDYYFIYKIFDNKVYVTNITPHINIQKNLIFTSIYLTLIFGIISYIISIVFVETALKKLNKLLHFLESVNIDNLHNKIDISGHPMDEINRLSLKFNETLEKINKQTLSLKDFVSNASHELKTPLMAISTEIDYVKKSKKYIDGLNNIKDQLQNMNSILETLTTISKIESTQNLEFKETNISKLTHTTIDTLQKLYLHKQIIIKSKISANIIKSVHPQSFNIIIKNLLDNAFKFTPKEGKIEINLDKDKIEIKDSGIGIAENNLDKVWERFWQVDSSKTDTKSFGLGLYLTKILVQKHGRQIYIKSEIKKGTTFTIKFS
ncbi:MAG: HAMP domain-containing sensor histidine kinase [Candidatus Absconditicoccaceae bacterium]